MVSLTPVSYRLIRCEFTWWCFEEDILFFRYCIPDIKTMCTKLETVTQANETSILVLSSTYCLFSLRLILIIFCLKNIVSHTSQKLLLIIIKLCLTRALVFKWGWHTFPAYYWSLWFHEHVLAWLCLFLLCNVAPKTLFYHPCCL